MASTAIKLAALEEELQRVKIELESRNAEIDELLKENSDQNQQLRDHEKKILCLEEEKKALMKDIDDLKDTVSALEKVTPTVYVAQAGSLFQQAICVAVLPEIFEGDSFATIKRLIGYLSGKIKLPVKADLTRARKRWEDICKEFNWTDCYSLPDEVKAINELKGVRNKIAHPAIELKKIMQYIPGVEVAEYNRKRLSNIFESLLDKMVRSGLYHKDIVELNIKNAHYNHRQ